MQTGGPVRSDFQIPPAWVATSVRGGLCCRAIVVVDVSPSPELFLCLRSANHTSAVERELLHKKKDEKDELGENENEWIDNPATSEYAPVRRIGNLRTLIHNGERTTSILSIC